MIDSISKSSSQFLRGLENLVALLLACIWLLVGALVALRYVFNSSIPGANEIVTMLFVFTTAIGAAIGVGRWEHIGITVFVDRFPKRVRWVLDMVRTGLVGGINGVVVFYSLGWIQTTGQFVMPSTGLPRMVVQVSIPIGCALATLFCIVRIARLYRDGVEGYQVGFDSKGLGVGINRP